MFCQPQKVTTKKKKSDSRANQVGDIRVGLIVAAEGKRGRGMTLEGLGNGQQRKLKRSMKKGIQKSQEITGTSG